MKAGSDRKFAGGLALPVLIAGVGAGWGGCGINEPTYFPGTILQVDGTGTGAKGTVPLRFRAPNDAERMELQTLTDQLGYDVPSLREDRVHVEVRYTIRNLGDREGMFSLFVDGASEFTRFDFDAVGAAFMTANEDAPLLGLIQISNPPILGPGQVYQGTVREDDFREASLDLHAMGKFMAPFVQVLINRSEVNDIGLEMTPPRMDPPREWILPALWEITLRFNADQPMSCQFLVRVRDDAHRLWEDGDTDFAPAPDTFTPTITP
jgi:hypothetical protein